MTSRRVCVELHALPALSISEHETRVSLYDSAVYASSRVCGVVVGDAADNEHYKIIDSFAINMLSEEQIDESALSQAWDMYRQVWPERCILGCYALGSNPKVHHASFHTKVMECTHMSTFPALLLLHEKNASSAAWHCFVNESSSYKPVPLSLCSAPDERLVLEDASQLAHFNDDSPTHSDLGATSQLLASLQSERRAVQMLHDRISLAYEYVIGVQNGTHPYDAAILSHISSSVVHRGPLSDNSKDHAASVPCLLQQKSSDAMFSSYLAALTNNLHALNEMSELHAFASSGTSPATGQLRSHPAAWPNM